MLVSEPQPTQEMQAKITPESLLPSTTNPGNKYILCLQLTENSQDRIK